MSKHHKHTSSNRALSTFIYVFTPILMLIIISAVCVIALVKPYNYIKPYMKIAFHDQEASGNVRTLNKYKDDNAPDLEGEVTDENNGTHEIIYPYYGDKYAVLNCENAGMNDIPVYWGDSTDLLELGAGHYNGSVFIGEYGNVVLAGHNHTYFYNLPNCKEGDIVTLETSYGLFTYAVSEIVYFKDTDSTYLQPTEDDRLTMYTCWNNGKLGMSDERIAVICKAVSKEFYN